MVRLSELVNQARRRMSEGKNFAQNPVQIVWQSVRKYGMLAYGKLSLSPGDAPKALSDQASPEPTESEQTPEIFNASPPVPDDTAQPAVVAFRSTNAPTIPTHVLDQTSERSDPPPLQPGERLQGGWWGVYTIKSCIHSQGWMRCYDGLQDNGNEAVWIYEYCFDPDSWSEDDIDERKRRFKHLIDLNLRLGQGSDFRIIRPKDVINPAGNRVYLITRPLPQSFTLGEFLQQQPGPWTRLQIERFLYQVLQSLQYLQTYLVNWPGDRWEQKLSHGRLSYEHLWVRLPDDSTELSAHPFFIYLGRFTLWEQLVWPQQLPIADNNGDIGSIHDDLQTLAPIVFALIRGYPSEDNPTDLDLWPNDDNLRALYPYVLQLLGQGERERFKSIDSAISILQSLPDIYEPPYSLEAPEALQGSIEESEEPQKPSLLLPLCLLGGSILLSFLTWLALSISSEKQQIVCDDPCRLKDVASDGIEGLRYDIEAGSSWGKGFFSTLTSPLEGRQLTVAEFQRTLLDRDPTLPLEKVHSSLVPKDLLMEYLRTDVLDVALMQQTEAIPTALENQEAQTIATDALEKKVVGYDGIAVFVAHSNAQRQDSITKRLRGQISLQKLRELLLDPNATLDGASVKLYWPKDETTVSLLRDFLFKSDADKVLFEQQRSEARRLAHVFPERENMYERMLSDFETNAQTGDGDTIGIGFNRISQLIGQCSVYPLALVDDGSQPRHLFVNADGNPIDKTTDLCGDKGTYWVNGHLFQRSSLTYPLAYEMAVVYHRSANVKACKHYEYGCPKGQLLADKLMTPEGQYLLSEVGLVPVSSIPEIRQKLWSPIATGGNP
ncbi:MAG: hypothetical protein AAF572_03025 [Cyanobacteria bacterium P01_B01_bin.77]